MIDEKYYRNYLEILKEELVPALGCTEPIAVAYAAALAKKTLGVLPEHMDVYCSGNIVKNVKSVTVPNSGGMRGIEAAAVLGAVGGNPDKKLEVLGAIRKEEQDMAAKLLEENYCICHLEEGVENLYIRVEAEGAGHTASVLISGKHTNIGQIKKDCAILFSVKSEKT